MFGLTKLILWILILCGLVFLTFFIGGKILKVALVLVVLIPLICTILFGDGHAYVAEFASFFPPATEEQIKDAYHFYYEQNAQNPVIDWERVQTKARDSVHYVADTVVQFFSQSEPIFYFPTVE